MLISVQISNSLGKNEIKLQTDENVHSMTLPTKQSGFGSSVNGGELLFLALAICYCNDIYREAAIKKIKVNKVVVNVIGEFGKGGEPAKDIKYSVKLDADATGDEILELIKHTDTVAEIQNTLRVMNTVILDKIEIITSN